MNIETKHPPGGSLTIEAFERLPDDGCRMDLVRGQVVREPLAGFQHGRIAGRIIRILGNFVEERGLGIVVGSETGFILVDEPPTVRAPDVAFVAAGRLLDEPLGFAPFAPDLAVEIVSPSNTIAEIQAKVLDYLAAGTRMVWIVEPRLRSVTLYRSREDIRLLTGDAEIDGADVLPGLRLALSALFGRA
jgi:Uma2 family endonuclease